MNVLQLASQEKIVFFLALWLSTMVTVMRAQDTRCGCNDCTAEIWESLAGARTCGAHIETEISRGSTEEQACITVSQRYPAEECGPYCNPTKCDGRAPPLCGCESCTTEIWNTAAGPFTCGQLVNLNMDMQENSTERQSCEVVASKYPVCSECACAPPPTSAPTQEPTVNATSLSSEVPDYCGCFSCTLEFWERQAGQYKCGERIQYYRTAAGGNMTMEEACQKVSDEYPYICGPACSPDRCDGRGPAYCGCADCTLSILNEQAGDYTCAEHISELRLPTAEGNRSEVEACTIIAGRYPACSNPLCNPDVCLGDYLKDHDREKGVPWAWAVIGANALFVLIIFIIYRKW